MNWTQQDVDELRARRGSWGNVLAEDTPDPGLESNLQSKCQKYCRENGWPCLSFRQSAKARGFITPGWPDMTILTKSGVVFVELKSKGGRLRKEQAEMKRIFNWLGNPIHVVRSYAKFLDVIGPKALE